MYHFYILLHLTFSFSLTRSLLLPYAYASIKSIDCILLSSFELKAILLISSVKIWPSLLNLCHVFNIVLLFFINFLSFFFFLKQSMLILFFSRYFILFSSLIASKQFLLFSNLSFLFITHFLCLLLFYLHYCHL